MKYYIRVLNKKNNEVLYRQHKCIEGWNRDKTNCWQFSRQGALGVIRRLQSRDIMWKRDWLTYSLEEAKDEN